MTLTKSSGDLVRIAAQLIWPEAQFFMSVPLSGRYSSHAADAFMSKANHLLSFATGVARILVHEINMAQANELAAAIKLGEFELGEDIDIEVE